ncbi:Lysosomal alpha-mannosidase II [Carabus blaptoides fortunei]
MATDEVPSVSVTIDHESRKLPFRHSLQPKPTPLEIPHHVRRATSIGRNRPLHHNIKKPSVPDIPETEKSEEDETEETLPEVQATAGGADNTRISFTKKSRKVSNISKASKRSSVERTVGSASAAGNAQGSNGYVNQGFVNNTYAQSTRSSSFHGSMTSLPVMREQYCCCQRWTKMEKYLALIVAFLAIVIIGLIIAVGVTLSCPSKSNLVHRIYFFRTLYCSINKCKHNIAMMISGCLLLILLTTVVNGKPTDNLFYRSVNNDGDSTCGYAACHPIKPGMLNVHLVPHTHDDVGWLKTVDQYYYGSKSNVQKAGVQYILDSVIQELLKDPNKRFIYVETAYLWKWWKKQHDTLRHQVKKLINRGQLEIIGGAWVMNDEAVTHYQSIIDQFTWGLRKLNETFGECGRPRIGWQIDPFGHSREMASIFAQLGFDGLLFGRLDYQDKRERLSSGTAEMLWQGSANLGNSSQLFTSILYNNYGPPPGFCFDVLCSDDPIIDDKHSPDYNVDMKVAQLFKYVRAQSVQYQTPNIILTMGEDFNYQDAHAWFVNLDKLIRHTNALQATGSKVNLLYSTPSCYLKAVHDEDKNKQWPVKYDDFFPYASDPHTYWTGYFTSRPTIKRFERIGNNFLQVCKQLYALTDLGPEDWVDLNSLREAMGVMQHHDAVTGTEKENVAHDYARLLSEGLAECGLVAKTALSKIITSKHEDADPVPKLQLDYCPLLNISSCELTEKSDNFVVTLYNPLSRPVSHYVRLPVTGTSYTVTDPSGTDLTVQLTPIPDAVFSIPGRVSSASAELVFHASDLPPLGFKSYFVKQLSVGDITLEEDTSEDRNILKDGNIQLKMDESSGRISQAKINGVDITIRQDFLWYQGCAGDNKEFKNRSSGAYIFRPNGTDASSVSPHVKTKVFKGPLTQEFHQVFNDWVSQVIRIYAQESYVEFEWLVGPIPVNDKLGKEIISRFTVDLKTNGTFYTDSNGREMLKRVRNYRPTWKVNIAETVAGNYYPVTSKILVQDEAANWQLAILTDRAQGGSSLRDGEIELMVHRRLLHDDAFGVGEALDEKAFGTGLVARGQHYLLTGPVKNTAHEKDVAQRKLLSAWTFITPTNDMSYQQYKNQYVMQYAGLKHALPKNVQILTLEPWKASTFLLRLEHIMEKDDDPELSRPVNVDIKNLFTPFTVKSVRETTLGGNQWIEQNQRLKWNAGEKLEHLVHQPDYYKTEEDNIVWLRNHPNDTNEIPTDNLTIGNIDNAILKDLDQYNTFEFTLEPMQIRTFVIDIDKL